ncbi:DNA primase large subunit eukaryotic protein [Dioscorea alata]|uniref:DNA primase large subunit eukaryotic protein n=1 Tax=Dioscorea alata TaxID=55571 RepID=A0ACB7W6H5_DIOAL|nr:DNA primase large subunit eukaryotic protein [Dioscorea alata]
MEIVGSRKPAADEAPILSLYRSAPQVEVILDDFERFAIDRLLVLKGVSDGLSRGKKPEEMEKLVKELWRTHMGHPDASETRNKDIISHFILRLVYCRTEDLRNWFLSAETTLFRCRYRLQNLETQRMLLAEFDFPYKALSQAEFEVVKEKLVQVSRSIGLSPNDAAESVFFKMPFEEVSDLVSSRKVFLLKGYAYVAMSQVSSPVTKQFRRILSKALELTNRKWTSISQEKEKNRLTPIVESLSSSYLGPDYSQHQESSEISLRDIDRLANNSFPPCMRHLFEKLREDHHLKHGGRMQLSLFLKGVGLKLEDALTFWKAEFSQKVGTERFDKEYAYSIRHNYGKEGKRTDYTPYSCQKIISSTPGVGDHHGCPYRHFSEENLRAALTKMGVGGHAMDDIMQKVQTRHYQLACTLTFEAVHGISCDTGVNHPNQYFIESRKALELKRQPTT